MLGLKAEAAAAGLQDKGSAEGWERGEGRGGRGESSEPFVAADNPGCRTFPQSPWHI